MKSYLLLASLLGIYAFNFVYGQEDQNYIRIAKLIIDSGKVDDYKKAVKEHAEVAVSIEQGVIMLYAVSEKNRPTHFTVFEIYADKKAYDFHIRQPHFLKYKEAVKDMVENLELIDVTPVAMKSKLRLPK
ncbi:MAG: antibiotic biosynthesis monooxygenase [Chitinophagaceae bacterium]|nr:MAG: antibiotic biosynthesis monooxygenase [Chitinophagaceae bacterium]